MSVYTKAFEGWLSEMEVVYNQEAIDKASQEAAAKQEDLVEQPVEAMPTQPEAEAPAEPAPATNP